MLGIGGALQTQLKHPPLSDIHKKNVAHIHASLSKEGDDVTHDDTNEPSSSTTTKLSKKEIISRKRKRKDGLWIELDQIILESKQKLQDGAQKNGVTFALIGSSGCGKSTVIRKIFIEKIFDKKILIEKGEKKEFIIQIFTESSKSDAFQNLHKDIIIDSKGLDQDNINFCYHMNEGYDKKYNFLIILDDVIDIQYKNLVRRMFLTMRNTNISSIISLQYPNLIPKSIRTSVYFTLLFHMNNDEAVEIVVRGWLANYLPGKTFREKMQNYLSWTLQENGHQFFLRDNLSHKVYQVDSNYYCKELPLLQNRSTTTEKSEFKKRKIEDVEDIEKSDEKSETYIENT